MPRSAHHVRRRCCLDVPLDSLLDVPILGALEVRVPPWWAFLGITQAQRPVPVARER